MGSVRRRKKKNAEFKAQIRRLGANNALKNNLGAKRSSHQCKLSVEKLNIALFQMIEWIMKQINSSFPFGLLLHLTK